MKETEANRTPETSEQIKQDLLDYIKDTEFGSVKYQAASDYFAINRLRYSLKMDRDNILSVGADQKKKIQWESEIRITETHIALLEHEIENNQARIQGYSKTYWHLWAAFEDLATATNMEAKNKYPSDSDKRNTYSSNVFNSIYDQISDVIYAHQEEK